MKHILFLFLTVTLTVSFSFPLQEQKTIDPVISTEELKLYDMIMAYRKTKGLPKIPLSKSLTYVAQEHCKDLYTNKPDLGQGCNGHSWSDKGAWSSCCYTPDHKQSTCVWNKPRELTNYKTDGYEIVCGSSDPKYTGYIMTPEYALESWKKSPHHNNTILNADIWKGTTWNAIGIGIYKGFAAVWFGKTIDEAGEPRKK